MSKLSEVLNEYNALGIKDQIDYDKLYLYSIITHSTAIEGSTVTEVENRLLFDEGISPGRTVQEEFMNLDLKKAYEEAYRLADEHVGFTPELLCKLSGILMKNTGSKYNTITGSFDSSAGDLRLLNVSAGRGGRSYMAWEKVPPKLQEFCDWLNSERSTLDINDVDKAYELSFKAHYDLVFIHPWADGNGRLSRLVMNMLQYEFGLVPSIVLKEDRAEYIKSLDVSQQDGDMTPFLDFMMDQHIKNIETSIAKYKESLKNDTLNHKNDTLNDTLKLSDKEKKVFDLIKDDQDITIKEIMDQTGFSRPTVTRAISSLSEKKLISRVGSKKTGHWEVKA